jgi:transposase
MTIPMVNKRERQTYYGAINPKTRTFHGIVAEAGNSYWTTIFVTYLCEQYPNARIVLCWDGASYHRGEEMRTYLEALNHGCSRDEWRITCHQFAPHAPTQNPIECIWLHAKDYVRKQWQRCTDTFSSITTLFEEALEMVTWDFEKLFMYTPFLKTK